MEVHRQENLSISYGRPTSAATSEPVQEPTTPEPVTPEPETPEASTQELPTDPAPVVEPKPEQPPVTSVKKDTPKPAEETPTPDPVEPEDAEGAEEQSQTQTEEKPSDTPQTPPQTDQPKLSAKEQIENSEWFKEYKQRHPEAWVDEGGGLHSSVANGDSGDIMG